MYESQKRQPPLTAVYMSTDARRPPWAAGRISMVVGTTSRTTMAATCQEEQRVSQEEMRPSCRGRGVVAAGT
jgi:hypothetical protein